MIVQQCKFLKSSQLYEFAITEFAFVANQVHFFDLCLFKDPKDQGLIGAVLAFSYMDENTWQAAEYSSHFVNVTGKQKAIGVLCYWYSIDNNYKL